VRFDPFRGFRLLNHARAGTGCGIRIALSQVVEASNRMAAIRADVQPDLQSDEVELNLETPQRLRSSGPSRRHSATRGLPITIGTSIECPVCDSKPRGRTATGLRVVSGARLGPEAPSRWVLLE
jgi:hypothetical protein